VVVTVVGGYQLSPAVALADPDVQPQPATQESPQVLRNVVYRARIDGVSRGATITYSAEGGQTQTANPTMVPGRVFEANAVLPASQTANIRVSIEWPYSANLHCEILVDDQIVAQAVANRENSIGFGNHPVLERTCEPVLERTFAPGPVADRGIFPESADFIDHRNAQLAGGADRGHAAERGRVRMDHVGPPFLRKLADRLGKRGYLSQLAEHRLPACDTRSAVEREAVHLFHRRAFGRVTLAGDAAHLHPGSLLAFQDGARAKGVTAVER
jgi:hypothetical protein